jgi:hypothetical protein
MERETFGRFGMQWSPTEARPRSTVMATVTSSSATAPQDRSPAAGQPGSGQFETVNDLAVAAWNGGSESDSKSDRYLAKRLAAASADYKGVALTTFLLGTGVAGFLWLAAGVLIEHWLVPGGLPRGVRWAWLAVGVVALVAAACRWILPLVRYRVNLVYAARQIEREHPELHNDLVNTVLVKAHPEGNAPLVVRSLERRAAKRLSGVPAEGVVDRSLALRLAYALAVLVGLACLYEVAAPKSLFVTAIRLLAPWTAWGPPSRVRIDPPRLAWRMPDEKEPVADEDGFDRRGIPIESGDATHVRGRQILVAADIRGLRRDERPVVNVAPLRADGGRDHAAPTWQVEMVRGTSENRNGGDAEGGAANGSAKRFVAVLPDAVRGLDSPIEIAIAAGDARSEPVRILVVDSPSLLVREVRYEYPRYTGRQSETVEWQGDLRAVEGTQVTLVAESNQPLDDAWIDFGCDGNHDLKFGKSANDLARFTKSFHLHMNDERTGPEHASYRLRFLPRAASSTARAKEIADAMEHRIEVIADLAPEVSIEEPRESPLRVPPSEAVVVRVRAVDPDFALARVGIEVRLKGAATQSEVKLLEGGKTGVFKGTARLVPDRLGAGAGSVLEYRAVAVDNRPKTPNVSHSPWQALQIDPTAPPRQPERNPSPAGEREQGGSQGEPQSGGSNQQQGDNQQGEQQQGDKQQGEPQQGDKNQGDKNQGDKNQGEQQSGGSNQQQGEQQQGSKGGATEGGNQGTAKESDGEKQRGGKQGQGENQGQGADQGQGLGAKGERAGGNQSGKGQQAGDGGKNSGQGSSTEGNSGDRQNQNGDGDASANSGGDKRPGERQAEGKQSGGKPGSNDRAGSKPPPNAVAADGTNDGEAMERILEHRRQAGGGAEEKQPGKQAAQAGEKNGDVTQPSQKQGGQQQDGKQQESQQGSGEKQPDNGQRSQAPCAGADGKPCGKEGCPSCSGGGASGAGGAKSSGQGKSGGENAAGDAAGEEEGVGQTTAGKEGAGKEGAGKEGAGKEGAGKEGAGKEGAGKEGAGKEGAGKEGAGKEGAGKEGAGKEGAGDVGAGKGSDNVKNGPSQEANGQAGRVGDDKPGPGGQPAQPAAGKPGDSSTPTGSGGWVGGDRQNSPDGQPGDGPAPAKEMEWDEQDLANARNAANLAVEHLRNAVDSGRNDVLDQLGWTREQAREFLGRWERMRKMSESGDPVERGAFERAVRSLGLRPAGVRSSRDVPADVKGGQAEGRRSRPPSEYREQFKAYTQGTAGE